MLIFWTKFSQIKCFHSKAQRVKEHHHQSLHIRFSLGTTIQLKQTTLTFWSKYAEEGNFRFKTEKVNITNKFNILE